MFLALILSVFVSSSFADSFILSDAKKDAETVLSKEYLQFAPSRCSKFIQKHSRKSAKWFLDHYSDYKKLSDDYDQAVAQAIAKYEKLSDPEIELISKKDLNFPNRINRKAIFENQYPPNLIKPILPNLNNLMNASLKSGDTYEIRYVTIDSTEVLFLLIHTIIQKKPTTIKLIPENSRLNMVSVEPIWTIPNDLKFGHGINAKSADAFIRFRDELALDQHPCSKLIQTQTNREGYPFLMTEKFLTPYELPKKSSTEPSFLKKLLTVDNTKYPKSDPYYTFTELKQIQLLSCVRKIIQNGHGGTNAPVVAFHILEKAFRGENSLTPFESKLNQSIEECESSLIQHAPESLSKEDLKMDNRFYNLKIGKVISSFLNPGNLYCKAVLIEAEMYWLLGGGAGVNHLQCVRSDGRVFHYIGPHVKFGVGGIALAGVAVLDFDTSLSADGNSAQTNSVLSFIQRSEGTDNRNLGDAALIIGKTFWRHSRMDGGLKLGLGVKKVAASVGFGVRVHKGREQWKVVLDQVK